MKNLTVSFFFGLCFMASSHAAQLPLKTIRCDFSEGIPETFTLIDADGNTPSADTGKYGFAVGNPWVTYYVESESNDVAVSTSWYSTSGTSSDWMILPALTIESADCLLSWRAMATDKYFSDGYEVYVSESGTDIADFNTAQPLFSVAAEEASWQRHSVSLADYVGKTIHIAFVNNSTDCAMLYLDDIFAGKPNAVNMKVSALPFVKPNEPITISGQVFTDLTTSQQGFTVGCNYGEKSFSANYADAVVNPGENVTFTLDTDITLALNETAELQLWVEHDGQRVEQTFSITGCITKVVAEEITGSWCGFCVRGIAAMQELKEKHPESFIGIAVHGDDFLEVDDYLSYIYSLSRASGYPHGIVNRNKEWSGDPADFSRYYEEAVNGGVKGSVKLTVTAEEDGSYTAKTNNVVAYGCTDGHYQMGYVIVENDVYEENDNRYVQQNYYSDGELGEMGGFENLPKIITDFHFDDVARGVVEDVKGIEGSLPRIMTAGKTYTHETNFTLPANVLDAANVEIVALLLDTRNGSVVNADAVKLGNDPTSGVTFDSNPPTDERTELFTVDGKRVDSRHARKGIYIQRTTSGGKTTVRKIVLDAA